MIYIDKGEVPDFLQLYINKNPDSNYDSESFVPFRNTLREQLVKEQKGLCAYCCSKISIEDSHNEHIEPRNKQDGSYSKRSLDYYNLVASCNKKITCGKYKKNDYDENRFISPLDKKCDDLFLYDPDGYISGDDYTIDLLNLNDYELMTARKATYKIISNMTAEDIRMCFCADEDQYYPFSNVILWYLRNIAN